MKTLLSAFAVFFVANAKFNLGLEWDRLAEPLKSYSEPEASRLLRELEALPYTAESHSRRRDTMVGVPSPSISSRRYANTICCCPARSLEAIVNLRYRVRMTSISERRSFM